jgi:hypothetical protein
MPVTLDHLPAYGYTPDIGWSSSRYGSFKTCALKYFWSYYAKFDTEVDHKYLDRLKNLTSIPFMIGTAAHETIEQILRRRVSGNLSPIDRPKLKNFVSQLIIKKMPTAEFCETYYNTKAVKTEDLITEACQYVFAFLDSEIYQWIMKSWDGDPAKTIIETPNFGETRVQGMKAYLKTDFMFVDAKDGLHIFDWKTGKPKLKEHLQQVKAYSVWTLTLPKKPAKITAHVVYLNTDHKPGKAELTDGDVQESLDRIRTELGEMSTCCLDPANNVPKAKTFFVERAVKNNLCPWCSFREACPVYNPQFCL